MNAVELIVKYVNNGLNESRERDVKIAMLNLIRNLCYVKVEGLMNLKRHVLAVLPIQVSHYYSSCSKVNCIYWSIVRSNLLLTQ